MINLENFRKTIEIYQEFLSKQEKLKEAGIDILESWLNDLPELLFNQWCKSNFTEDEIKEQAILLYSENKQNREEILESLKNDEIFQEEMKERFGKQVIKDSEIIRVMSNNAVDYLMQDFQEDIKSYDNAYDFVEEIKETDTSEFIRLHSILDTINFFKILKKRMRFLFVRPEICP